MNKYNYMLNTLTPLISLVLLFYTKYFKMSPTCVEFEKRLQDAYSVYTACKAVNHNQGWHIDIGQSSAEIQTLILIEFSSTKHSGTIKLFE